MRVTVKDTAGVPVDSWSDYYPFGKEARGSNTVNEPKEQFTGKERDAETGLDYFGARYYNADIARFTSLDPDRDKYPHWTPYSYAGNMPVHLVDVNGRGPGLAEAVSTGLGSLGLGALGRAIFPPLLMMDAVAALSWVGDQMNQSAAAYEASKGNITNIESATTSYIPTESATVDQTSVQIPTQLGDGNTVSFPSGMGSSTTVSESTKPIDAATVEAKSTNQINKDIQTGRAPSGLTRADNPKVKGEQQHMHLGKENALNVDGTWKHGETTLTNAQKKYLKENGWKLPGEAKDKNEQK